MSSSPDSNVIPSAPAVPTLPVAVPSLDNNYGAILLGTFGGLMIYGLTMHQGYRYMQHPRSKTEPTYIKAWVVFLLIMETVHSILAMHFCYYSLVINYCRPDVLFQAFGTWSFSLLPVFTVIIVATSQSFFAFRLFRLNRRHAPLAMFVAIIILGELSAGIALTVESFVQPGLSHWKEFSYRLTSTALGMAITADVFLTTVLTVVLHRSRTGFKSTDSMINVLIMYTINTGLLTGTLATMSFFVKLKFSKTLIGDALTITTAKLYGNSMLAVLNSRNSPSGYTKDDFKGNAHEIGTVPVNDLSTHSATALSGHDVSTASQHVLHIRVTRQTGTSENESFSGDVTLVDRKVESSIELCNMQSSTELKGNAAPSPDGLFHHD